MGWNTIDSVKNSYFQEIKQLKNTSEHQFILNEWQHIIWLLESENPIYKVKYCISDNNEFLNTLNCTYKLSKSNLFFAKTSILKHIINKTFTDNIIAMVEIKNTNENINNKHWQSIILDKVKDFGNIGTIIRNTYMLGINNFIMINQFNYYYGKVIDASRGLIFYCNLFFFNEYEKAIEFLNTHNFFLIIASVNGDNKLITLDKNRNIGIVLGNETTGHNEILNSLPHINYSIPMINSKICDSMNVAATGAIIIYQLLNCNIKE